DGSSVLDGTQLATLDRLRYSGIASVPCASPRDPAVDAYAAPEPPVTWQGLLGYLNFADGKPDARFQQQFHAAFRQAAQAVAPGESVAPAIANLLDTQLTALQDSGAAAFRDVTQARAVVSLALRDLPPAYRRHHADLLAQQGDADLLAPF